MDPIVYRITLDLAKSGVQHVLSGFKVGDTNRRLEIRLTNNGIPYVIGKGVSARISASLQNGKYDGLCDIKGNVVIYDVETTILQEGEIKAEFKLCDVTNDQFTSSEIMFLVYPQETSDNPAPPTVEPFASVGQALAYTRVAADRANTEAANAEAKAKVAEEAADLANEAANAANTAAANAEAKAISSATVNSSGNLVVTLKDNTAINAGYVIGAKGDKGDQGIQGIQGEKGEKGDKGDSADDLSLLANALKGTASEASVIYPQDISPVKHEMFVTLKSDNKNLLTYPYNHTTKTKNGITFADNGDGTISVNGTATDYANFIIDKVQLEAGKSYTLSGCPPGGSSSKYCLYFVHPLEDGGNVKDYGNGATGTRSHPGQASVYIFINKGATCNNLVFKPQLELGDAKTEWSQPTMLLLKKYTKNYVPYPHKHSEGEKTVSYGVTFVDNGDNTITANGKNSGGTTSNYYPYDADLDTPIPAGNYILYGCGKDGLTYSSNTPFRIRLTLRDEDGNRIYVESNRAQRAVPFTLEKPAVRLQFGIRITQGVTVENQKFYTYLFNVDDGIAYTLTDNNSASVASSYPEVYLFSGDVHSIVSVEYNRDINKAFAELQKAILNV